jgi:hypothetical protein
MHLRLLGLPLAFVVSAVQADSPLPPPQRIISCSSSGEVCAESDPNTNVTTIRKRNADALWSFSGWHRWLFVAEDGRSVVVGYGGMNLVPSASDLQVEVLHFYNQGKLIRSVKLADLYSDRSQLVQTVSHLAWVHSIHVNRANQLVLELVTAGSKAFAMHSGELQPEIKDGA